MNKKQTKENMVNNEIARASAEVVQRYGAAVKEHLVPKILFKRIFVGGILFIKP